MSFESVRSDKNDYMATLIALGAVVNCTIVLAHSYKTELLLLFAIIKMTGIKTDFIP